jgi:hypothetical protein
MRFRAGRSLPETPNPSPPQRPLLSSPFASRPAFGVGERQPNREENVTARFLADDREAQDCPVEGFRSLEVIDVDGGFNNGLDFQGSLHPGWSLRPLSIQFAQLPRPQRQPENYQNQKPDEQLEYAHEPKRHGLHEGPTDISSPPHAE